MQAGQTHVNFFVFAFDSTDLEKLTYKLRDMHQQRSLPEWSRVDCVCVLEKGVILNRLWHGNGEQDFTVSGLPEPGSELVCSHTHKRLRG